MNDVEQLRERLRVVLRHFPRTKSQIARELNTSNDCVDSFISNTRKTNIKTLSKIEAWIMAKEALIREKSIF